MNFNIKYVSIYNFIIRYRCIFIKYLYRIFIALDNTKKISIRPIVRISKLTLISLNKSFDK